MTIGCIRQDGDKLVVTIPPVDLMLYGLAVGDTIACTIHRVDPTTRPGAHPRIR